MGLVHAEIELINDDDLPMVRRHMMDEDSIEEYDVVDNVQVRFKNRATTCRAMVLPRDSEPLLFSALVKNPFIFY